MLKNFLFIISALLFFAGCEMDQPEPDVVTLTDTVFVEVVRVDTVLITRIDTVETIINKTTYLDGVGDTVTVIDTIYVTVVESVTISKTDTFYVDVTKTDTVYVAKTDTVEIIKTDTVYIDKEKYQYTSYTKDPWSLELQGMECVTESPPKYYPLIGNYSYFWTYRSGDAGAETIYVRYRIHIFEDESSNYRMVATTEEIDPGYGYVDKTVSIHYDHKISSFSYGTNNDEIWDFDIFARENYLGRIICNNGKILEIEFANGEIKRFFNEKWLKE